MIQMQDITIFDIPVETKAAEQRIVFQNGKPENADYQITYNVQQPKKPQIVTPNTETISPVISYIIQKLQTGTVEEKERCLLLIKKNLETKGNVQYLDEGLTNELFNIANEDISHYKEATAQQKRLRKKLQERKKLSEKEYQKAYTLSEKEKAESNQIEAIFLVAKIQNVLYKEMKKRSDLQLKFYDMPAVPKLINEAKNNKNDNIKIASINALCIMYKYEFYKDMTALFDNIAQTSESQLVKNEALQAKAKITAKYKKQIQKERSKASSFVF